MEVTMDAIVERCAGLDVHLDTVVACVLYGKLDIKPKKEVKTFSTTTKGLLELLDFINQKECTHVAMESTGIYWKPVWNILESGAFDLIVANAKKIKNVPGRKTGEKKTFCKLKLQQNNDIIELVMWDNFYKANRDKIIQSKNKMIIVSAIIKYSDYSGCHCLQTYKSSMLFNV